MTLMPGDSNVAQMSYQDCPGFLSRKGILSRRVRGADLETAVAECSFAGTLELRRLLCCQSSLLVWCQDAVVTLFHGTSFGKKENL